MMYTVHHTAIEVSPFVGQLHVLGTVCIHNGVTSAAAKRLAVNSVYMSPILTFRVEWNVKP